MAPVKPTQAGKASKETLNKHGCKVCPLDKANNFTPKMSPDIVEQTDIYFLGESPDHTDDQKGSPFSSRSGKLLKSILGNVDTHSFDNVIRDFNNPFAERPAPAWIAMECCRSLIVKSIEQAQPKIIVGLGILPLQWMLNSSDMLGLRGRVFAVQVGKHKCWFMPTYAPQEIMDKAYDDKAPLRSKLGHCLKFDLFRAVRLTNELTAPTIDTPQRARAGIQTFNGASRSQLAVLLKLISAARKAPEKAIDIEASHLRPQAIGAKLLTVAISFQSANEDVNFSFAIDHSKAGWSLDEKKTIKLALQQLLTDDTTIIAHNASFEIGWLIAYFDENIVWHDNWECTMMQSHFLDERRGKRGGGDEEFGPNPYQALDFLVKQHYGIAFKSLFKVDRKNMAKADLDETLLYNGADTKYTLRLFCDQYERLKKERLLAAYNEAKPRQPAVALMQHVGINVDRKQTAAMQEKLGGEIKVIEEKIFDLPVVKKFITERKEFNPASGIDVAKIFKDYLKVNITNAEGKDSTDKSVLTNIDHPLAKLIEEFRNRSKLKSTNVDVYEYGKGAFIWPDSKLHPSFNTTFAETGRTSSDEPNQQNWPKRNDEWVRKQIIPSLGNVLVAFDYGQLEACTGAMCSKDKVFVKALWEDYDIHMEWAQRSAHLYPALVGGKHMIADKDAMKKWRSVVKNKLVFPAFFGAAEKSVKGYLEVATGIEIPDHVTKKLFNDFWNDFSGFGNWQKLLVNKYYDVGYVESPTGRKRHYPLSRPQAINYPIQSLGCDIVCRAMVTLSKYAVETGKMYMHPIMNIHDDLTFDIPNKPQILEEAIDKIYRVMLDNVYPFINVPLSTTCSIGNNWLEMDEIQKFWSHKDL